MKLGRLVFWLLLGALAAGCADGGTVTSASHSAPAGVPVKVYLPDGPGPFPAVVLLHACSGADRGTTADWTRRLTGMGYLVAVPDSFTPRGYPAGVCGNGSLVSASVRAADAYATLYTLSGRKDVIPTKVGVMGHSHGGWTVVAVMNEAVARRSRQPGQPQNQVFAAGIAFYPSCTGEAAGFGGYWPTTPLLILAGEKDDWTPAAPCVKMAETAAKEAPPVTLKVYPGAMHGFDGYAPYTRIALALGGRGASIKGDPAAREDSIVRVRDFFAKYLKGE